MLFTPGQLQQVSLPPLINQQILTILIHTYNLLPIILTDQSLSSSSIPSNDNNEIDEPGNLPNISFIARKPEPFWERNLKRYVTARQE